MKPLVSVLIPSYNHAAYITQTVESIVKQSYGYENIELLVIDDASTDASFEILKRLQTKYQFTLLQNKSNMGVAKNLNFLLERTKGKYICLVGSDDYWMLNKLEIQVAYMEKNKEVAVCSGNALRIDANGHLLPTDKQLFSAHRVYDFVPVFMRNFPFVSTNAMMRKVVLDEVGYFDEAFRIEDYYMWLKISHRGYPIHMLPEVIGYYRIHDTNTIHKSLLIYTEMKKIIAEYKDHPMYAKAKIRLDTVYFPQLAKVNKAKALALLPGVVSNTRFFYRGLYRLFIPNFIRLKNVKSWRTTH